MVTGDPLDHRRGPQVGRPATRGRPADRRGARRRPQLRLLGRRPGRARVGAAAGRRRGTPRCVVGDRRPARGRRAAPRRARRAAPRRAVRVDADAAREHDPASDEVGRGCWPTCSAGADLVCCGDYSLDGGSGSVPAFLAAQLGAAQALGLGAARASARRRRGRSTGRPGGSTRAAARCWPSPAPAVLSVEGGSAELRRAGLAAVLAARDAADRGRGRRRPARPRRVAGRPAGALPAPGPGHRHRRRPTSTCATASWPSPAPWSIAPRRAPCTPTPPRPPTWCSSSCGPGATSSEPTRAATARRRSIGCDERAGRAACRSGSTEQHGPHLPLDTDTRIAVALCAAGGRARCVGRRASPCWSPRPLAYGASGEHQGFAGTLSIGQDALELVVVELGRSAGDDYRLVVVRQRPRRQRRGRWPGPWRTLAHEGRPRDRRGRPALGAPATATPGAPRRRCCWPSAPERRAPRPGRGRASPTPLPELLDRAAAGGLRAVTPNGVLGDPTGASAEEGRGAARAWVADLVAAIPPPSMTGQRARPTAQTHGRTHRPALGLRGSTVGQTDDRATMASLRATAGRGRHRRSPGHRRGHRLAGWPPPAGGWP